MEILLTALAYALACFLIGAALYPALAQLLKRGARLLTGRPQPRRK